MGADPDVAIVKLSKQVVHPDQAWATVVADRGFERGHGYSGSFSEKPGYRMIVDDPNRTDGNCVADLKRLEGLIFDLEEGGSPIATEQDCRACWGRTVWLDVYVDVVSVQREEEAGLLDRIVRDDAGRIAAKVPRTCRQCDGTGKVPADPEEVAKAQAERLANAEAQKRLGLTPQMMARLAQTYNDKWGPAAAVRAGEFVWFGGLCSS